MKHLPYDLYSLGESELRGLLDERTRAMNGIVARLGDNLDGATPADVRTMREINNDLDRIKAALDNPLEPHPGYPMPGRSSRPGQRGKAQSFSAAVIDGFGGIDGIRAAVDATSGGTAAPSFYNRNRLDMPTRRLYLRDLIPTVSLETDRFEYVRQTVATNNATAVAAGAAKPTSIYTLERVSSKVTTIAHLSEPVDRALAMDFAVADFLDHVLVTGVLQAEEAQILSGNGAGANLLGILSTPGIQTQAKGTDPTPDAIYKAITKVRNQNFTPDAILVHPNDWQDVRLLRTADGEYIWGTPSDAGPESIWDVPVLVTTAMSEGTALVGHFALGATVYDREQARVSFTEVGALGAAGAELFKVNQLLWRGESRLGLAVPFPLAFCTVTGV